MKVFLEFLNIAWLLFQVVLSLAIIRYLLIYAFSKTEYFE